MDEGGYLSQNLLTSHLLSILLKNKCILLFFCEKPTRLDTLYMPKAQGVVS